MGGISEFPSSPQSEVDTDMARHARVMPGAMSDKSQPINRAAEILGKSPRTILRWIQSGKVPAKQVDGEWRVDITGVMPHEKTATADVVSGLHEEMAALEAEVETLKGQLASQAEQIRSLNDRLHEANTLFLREQEQLTDGKKASRGFEGLVIGILLVGLALCLVAIIMR
jgi:tetrahydromethanopterin S-methyltransferase subunit F